MFVVRLSDDCRTFGTTMNEKEMLKRLFEFETYCTARFDSQARVALAVYEYVKQMKENACQDLSRRTHNT